MVTSFLGGHTRDAIAVGQVKVDLPDPVGGSGLLQVPKYGTCLSTL